MDIELISAELRPRRPWEAIDLGVSLYRRHMGKLLLFWCLSVLPLILIVSLLLWWNHLLLVLVIWWLKPLYDRVPLFYLSRALFGSPPTLRELYRALPKLWTRRLFDALVVARVSFVRSSVMPIKELEGLSGPSYPPRRDALLRSGSGQAQCFTSLCLFLEHFFTYALILLATSATPQVSPPDPLTYLRALSELVITGDLALDPALIVGLLVAWILSLTFIENLYVAGGFALYLNARTELEGWDVELTFRRIANRIRRIQAGGLPVIMATAAACALVLSASPARAADAALDPPDEVIQQVLEHEDFEIHFRTEKVPVSKQPRGFDSAAGFVGLLGYALFWALVTGLAVFLVILIYRNRHYFLPSGKKSESPAPERKARTILGMEIGQDSLPRDVVGAARTAWTSGQLKEALSLLYRGTVFWLVESAQAPIRESDTEYDCLRHARATRTAQPMLGYIEFLTGTWIGVAYGREEPGDEDMERLLQSWPFKQGGPDA